MTTKHNSSGGGSVTIQPPVTAGNYTLTFPALDGTVLAGNVSTSTANTVTNKVAVVIGGVTYYLLASTSGA